MNFMSARPAADPAINGDTAPRPLDVVVTAAAVKLMAATVWTSVQISQQVLADLVAHFAVDVSFLRYNDHTIRASRLIAEWPPRPAIPDPDPLAVVYFADADPVFAQCEHAKEAAVFRPQPATEDYPRLIEAGSGVAASSTAAVPLVSGDITTGTMGFIKFGDRRWQPEELNALQAIASLFAQVQARIVAEEQLRYLADHDELTGLHNRRGLLAHLAERRRQREQISILFLDVDRLKNVNDDLGHAAGDAVLRAAGRRLRDVLGSEDVLARLGGDEFVASLVTPISDRQIQQLAERMHACLAEPILIEGVRLCIGASIGVVIAEHHDPRTPAEILRDADTAMYAAKNTGRGTTHYVADVPDARRAPTTSTPAQHLINVDPDQPCRGDTEHPVPSPAVIHQAIGILRSRSGATTEQAFQELHRMREPDHNDLTLLAHPLVEQAVRSAQSAPTPTP